jgi:hypothetical protein
MALRWSGLLWLIESDLRLFIGVFVATIVFLVGGKLSYPMLRMTVTRMLNLEIKPN